MTRDQFLQRYKPSIPRRFLFIITAIIWSIVGGVLCNRAYAWAQPLAGTEALLQGAIGLALATAGYIFGFSKIARRNLHRIETLPESVCLFAFTAWRGYLMIGLMIAIGITLRGSPLPKTYLIVPYAAMGGSLVLGSVPFYTRFFAGKD